MSAPDATPRVWGTSSGTIPGPPISSDDATPARGDEETHPSDWMDRLEAKVLSTDPARGDVEAAIARLRHDVRRAYEEIDNGSFGGSIGQRDRDTIQVLNALDALTAERDALAQRVAALEAFVRKAEKDWPCDKDDHWMADACDKCRALDALRATPTECDHQWVDARNSVALSGEVCPKCGAIRAGNTEASPDA